MAQALLWSLGPCLQGTWEPFSELWQAFLAEAMGQNRRCTERSLLVFASIRMRVEI